MVRRLALLLACLLTPFAAQGERLSGPVPAQILRVVDGDTLELRVRIWLDQELIVKARLADVDAPELFRPDCPAERALAERARDFVLAEAGRDVTLTSVEHDKYAGRVVAHVADDKGRDLSALLLSAGLAAPYGDRTGWCADGEG